jgi:class 3 adenylate cyclase
MSTATMTFLFTDIVASTEHALRLGDAHWEAKLAGYRATVRRELIRFGGHEVDTAGDGFFVTFSASEGAIRCAQSLSVCVDRLGLASRTGVHTGPCQTGGEKVSGVNVHVAARVMAAAQAGEVLLSSAVQESLSSPRLALVDAGRHALKGLPSEYQLYRAA